MNTPAVKLTPEQLRLIADKIELDEEIAHLNKRFVTGLFHELSQENGKRLESVMLMSYFSKVLGERIDAFAAPAEAEAKAA